MEKIDRELLIKEISSRLPYGVKAQVLGWNEEKGKVEVPLKIYSINNTDGYLSFKYHYNGKIVYIEDCRLYLRPMSSMTEEEENEWCGLNIDPLLEAVNERHTRIEDLMLRVKSQYNPLDWLNAHHFDFRNLIECGLAIAVTEENNPYKE